MIRLWHEAARRLRPQRRNAAVIGGARILIRLLFLIAGLQIQHMLTKAGILRQDTEELFLCASVMAALLACTPLRMQSDWQLGRLSGTLDENDLGFLACCGKIWLWCRAAAVRMLGGMLLMLSFLPMLVLYIAAKCVWLTIPADTESLLPLLTYLHLLLLTAAAVLLPLRVFAACAALPYCFLKMPHLPAVRVLRMAFRLSRNETASVIVMRILSFPLMFVPLLGFLLYPTLLTAEQLRCARAWRHAAPLNRSRFSHLELHAYDRG